MTRNLKIFSVVAAVSVLAAPCVLALDSAVLKVDVPFDFVVADRQLPSGEYRVVKTQDSGIVKIYSKDRKHMVATFSSPLPAELDKGGELVFHTHGNKRFLRIIRTAEGGAYVPESRMEKEATEATGEAVLVGMR